MNDLRVRWGALIFGALTAWRALAELGSLRLDWTRAAFDQTPDHVFYSLFALAFFALLTVRFPQIALMGGLASTISPIVFLYNDQLFLFQIIANPADRLLAIWGTEATKLHGLVLYALFCIWQLSQLRYVPVLPATPATPSTNP